MLTYAAYLGRQPIYGPNRAIRAYELLYRGNAGDTAARFENADAASAQVLLRAFLELGLPAVSPEQPVFVNHTRHLLELDPILPPDRCVVEVLEDVAADEETLAALRRLKALGSGLLWTTSCIPRNCARWSSWRTT
jgi:EAL and modified HD-GYP domain-containing signal transduction protein